APPDTPTLSLHDALPISQREGGVAPMTRASAAILSAFATLRANMTTRTEAGRHALRLALVAALAEVLVQAAGFYQGRWATLTVRSEEHTSELQSPDHLVC